MNYNSEEQKVIALVSIFGIIIYIISLPGVCIRYAFLKGKVPFKKLLTDEKNYNEFIGTFFIIAMIITCIIFIT